MGGRRQQAGLMAQGADGSTGRYAASKDPRPGVSKGRPPSLFHRDVARLRECGEPLEEHHAATAPGRARKGEFGKHQAKIGGYPMKNLKRSLLISFLTG